eukprot:EG_transcript_36651
MQRAGEGPPLIRPRCWRQCPGPRPKALQPISPSTTDQVGHLAFFPSCFPSPRTGGPSGSSKGSRPASTSLPLPEPVSLGGLLIIHPPEGGGALPSPVTFRTTYDAALMISQTIVEAKKN